MNRTVRMWDTNRNQSMASEAQSSAQTERNLNVSANVPLKMGSPLATFTLHIVGVNRVIKNCGQRCTDMEKVCWITYMKKAEMFAIFSQENDDSPAKCECAFDCYPTASQYTRTRCEAVDKNILYAINELVENGYVFIGII